MQVLTEIEALKAELDTAGDAITTAALSGLVLAADPPGNCERIGDIFAEILSLCAFQDLAGQRLDRLSRAVAGEPADDRPDAHLLNGPANGDGLDQAAADALFSR